MKKSDRIYIAGHTGLVGSALLAKLKKAGYRNLIFRPKGTLDLRKEDAVKDFFARQNLDYVFLAAGLSGGILANIKYPRRLFNENMKIIWNVVNCALNTGVKKLLYLGCSCMYPRNCPQPIREEYLLKGPLEPTNEMFALAKLAGLRLCQEYNRQRKTKFICCIAENLFGPNDKFGPEWGHVIPALIERFHSAKIKHKDKVAVWGSGKPVRGFMYIEDAADALIFLMKNYDSREAVNIGSGSGISIKQLAKLIGVIVGFKGKIVFDTTKPDGMPRKSLSIRRFSGLGWRPKFDIEEGIRRTYRWYLRCR